MASPNSAPQAARQRSAFDIGGVSASKKRRAKERMVVESMIDSCLSDRGAHKACNKPCA